MPTKPVGLKHMEAEKRTCGHDLPHDVVEAALRCAHEDAEATEAAQHKATALHAWTTAGYETHTNVQVLAQRETGRDVEAAAGALYSVLQRCHCVTAVPSGISFLVHALARACLCACTFLPREHERNTAHVVIVHHSPRP